MDPLFLGLHAKTGSEMSAKVTPKADDFERLTADSFDMPVRRAEKAVPFVDENGALVEPASPNAVKLETFIFDVLPLANNPQLLEVDRAEEFSPVKNLTRSIRWRRPNGIRSGAPAAGLKVLGSRFHADPTASPMSR